MNMRSGGEVKYKTVIEILSRHIGPGKGERDGETLDMVRTESKDTRSGRPEENQGVCV